MPELFAQADIAAPAEQVWALLADFGNIQAWWPRTGSLKIERVELEGEGIGMVRHIYNQGAPQCASERLELLDPQTFTLVLSIVGQRPGGMTAYVATSRLIPLGAQACRMEHRALLTTVPGRERAVERFLQQAYALMFAGLQSAVADRPAH